jgi:hypothetical protein
MIVYDWNIHVKDFLQKGEGNLIYLGAFFTDSMGLLTSKPKPD